METIETYFAYFLNILGMIIVVAMIFGCIYMVYKVVPLAYRMIVANLKIVEKKAEKIDEDDKTITII